MLVNHAETERNLDAVDVFDRGGLARDTVEGWVVEGSGDGGGGEGIVSSA